MDRAAPDRGADVDTQAIVTPVPASTMPIAAERRISPVVPSPALWPSRPTNIPPRKSAARRVAASVGTPVCRWMRVAPQNTIENSTAMTATRKTQASQKPIGSRAPLLVPDSRTRRGPARRSSPTITRRTSAGTSPRPHGSPESGSRSEHDRADECGNHRPYIGAGHPQARQPPARATEQRVCVAEECPGSETYQQRRAECRRERRSQSKDDDRDRQGGDTRAADTDLPEPPIEGGRDGPRQHEPDCHRARMEPDLGVAQAELVAQVGRDSSHAIHHVADGRDRGVRRPRVTGSGVGSVGGTREG